MYTAFKEITHMLTIHDLGHDPEAKSSKSARQVVMLIVLMNLIFSFDSHPFSARNHGCLPCSGHRNPDFRPCNAAAGRRCVTVFLQKNRMYEVLGLFILLIVGVVLLGEAGPAAAHAMHDDSLQIKVFGYALLPMSKNNLLFLGCGVGNG